MPNRDYNIAICELRQEMDQACFQGVAAEGSGFGSWVRWLLITAFDDFLSFDGREIQTDLRSR
jgi:hypothetical protein